MAQTALITGANRGIGREVATQLGRRGFRVLAAARDPQAADRTAAALREDGGDAEGAVVDVGDDDSVAALAATFDAAPPLDVLVSNAAAYVDWQEMATTADLEAARAVMEVNLFGTWRLVRALLPALRRAEDPRIVVTSSGAGSHGDEAFGLTARGGAAATYGISKAALNALVSTLAAELGDSVHITAVCPGLTATWPGAEQMGARPVADGAAGIVWAVTEPHPTGGFYRDGAPLPW